MSTRRDEFEQAIRELIGLLGEIVQRESAYQTWFETHQVAWEALGYVRAMPHPVLRDADGRELIPDFLAERPDGLADLVELKTPDLKLLVRTGHPRVRAGSQTTAAIAQLEDYSDYFAHRGHRTATSTTYGYRVPGSPRLVLIGGSSDYGPDDLHLIAERHRGSLTVLTYADVLHRLQVRLAQETNRKDLLHYYRFLAIVMVKAADARHADSYLFDVGLGEDHDRLSISVDPLGRLGFSATATDGQRIAARTRVPLHPDRWCRISCELSVSDFAVAATVMVDGVTQAQIESSVDFRLDAEVLKHKVVMGADLRGSNGAAMGLHFWGVFDVPADIIEQCRFDNWAATTVAGGDLSGSWVDFDQHQFLQAGTTADGG